MQSIITNFAKPDEIVISVFFHSFTFILPVCCHVDGGR